MNVYSISSMKSSRHLLVAMAASTLILSIISNIIPNYFTNMNAFAEDDNTASHNGQGIGNGMNSHEQEHAKSTLHAEDNGIEVKVETVSLNITDGAYRVAFVCEEPQLNKTLDRMLQVKDGGGKVEAKIALDNGTYSGCELVRAGTDNAIASFDSFAVRQQSEEDDHEQEHQARRHGIISKGNATKIHERHIKANPSSPGDYKPGLNFTLTGDGTATNDSGNSTHSANATVNVDLSVWKSTPAIILLDVIGGTVEVEGQQYNIKIGYALYSPNHGALRVGALATDDSGNKILKLILRGKADEQSYKFPTESGDSLDFSFDGNSDGPFNNRLDNWGLILDGTVAAG
jgi:hypothetical protein